MMTASRTKKPPGTNDRNPTTTEFMPLRNRIAFSYPEGAGTEVTGDRQYPSTEAPFQKFRWIHFPAQPVDGTYRYRVRKMHMPTDGKLKNGTTLSVDIVYLRKSDLRSEQLRVGIPIPR